METRRNTLVILPSAGINAVRTAVFAIYAINLATNARFISFVFVKARVANEGVIAAFALFSALVVHTVRLIASPAFFDAKRAGSRFAVEAFLFALLASEPTAVANVDASLTKINFALVTLLQAAATLD